MSHTPGLAKALLKVSHATYIVRPERLPKKRDGDMHLIRPSPDNSYILPSTQIPLWSSTPYIPQHTIEPLRGLTLWLVSPGIESTTYLRFKYAVFALLPAYKLTAAAPNHNNGAGISKSSNA